MTIPETTRLPFHEEHIASGGKALSAYMKELIKKLEDDYQVMAMTTNGTLRSDASPKQRNYTPTVSGGTTAGAGTYTHQTGWVMRQGLITDVWFDVRWSAHTGTGDLQLDLPYEAAYSDNEPFQGTLSAENLTFSGFLTGSVLPDSRAMEVIDTQSGGASARVAITNADTTIRGHIRYVGKRNEKN